MVEAKRYLYFGAHPDDPDLLFGGYAAKLIRAGHSVKFVACTNGDAGHFSGDREALAARRYREAQMSAAIVGLTEYRIWNIHDGELTPSPDHRKAMVRIIREFKPDVVISHRLNDYHPDHRATAQLVQDAAFMIMVPLYCPELPIPEKRPVFCYSSDLFRHLEPFCADIGTAIDEVLETKLKMLDCHVSQFYEWLPWLEGNKDFNCRQMTETERHHWLLEKWLCRDAVQAEQHRDMLRKFYGDAARNVKYAETLEISEYGYIPSPSEIKTLFMV